MPSSLSWCTAQQEHSFWYQPTKSLSLPPGLALGSCNKACLHVGTSWIPVTSLTAKLCLEHSFSTSFYQTSRELMHSHLIMSIWVQRKRKTSWAPMYETMKPNMGTPREVQNPVHLCVDETTWGASPGDPAEESSLGVCRCAVEDTHIKLPKPWVWLSKGTPFLFTSPMSPFPNLSQGRFFFSIPPFKKLVPSSLILSCIIKGTTNRDPAAGVKCLKTSADQSLEACLKQDTLMH